MEPIIDNGNVKNELISPFCGIKLVVDTQQTPGVVMFDNYEMVKQVVEKGVSFYANTEYTLDNYKMALDHYNQLKYVKDILEKAKKNIIKIYDEPLEVVEKQLDELIELVKKPFKVVDTFIKQNEKESKKQEILVFASKQALSLGLRDHIGFILNSPAFFNSKWANASCRAKEWQSEVCERLSQASKDIQQILSQDSEDNEVELAYYYQTLSMEQVMNLKNVVKSTSAMADAISLNQSNVQAVQEGEASKKISDYEILKFVADSINPYTGEVITGVDNELKNRLLDIARKIKIFTV